jgi:hypothetical protein
MFIFVCAFWHVLHRPSRFLDVPISQAPDRAHAFHLLRQPEGVAQQPVGVQFHQPLAFLHIGFSPGYVFGVPAQVATRGHGTFRTEKLPGLQNEAPLSSSRKMFLDPFSKDCVGHSGGIMIEVLPPM